MDVLRAFADAYADTLSSGSLTDRIQSVKDALFRRAYIEAFGPPENLVAYLVRWSPARALAYQQIFQLKPTVKAALKPGCRVVSIGGGAGAEIAALSQFPGVKVTTIDQGDWEPVVQPLLTALHTSATMIHGDALELDYDFSQVDIVTSLFTTNELFAQSKAGAVKFLQSLSVCQPKTLFIVLESAGSYSEITIGTKKFPVYYIIHHTLTSQGKWRLAESTDAEWFRLDPELSRYYPLKLENMRYFLRVYERV